MLFFTFAGVFWGDLFSLFAKVLWGPLFTFCESTSGTSLGGLLIPPAVRGRPDIRLTDRSTDRPTERPSRIFLAHFPEIEKCQKLHQRSRPELKPLPFEPEGGKSTLAHLFGPFSRNRKCEKYYLRHKVSTQGPRDPTNQKLIWPQGSVSTLGAGNPMVESGYLPLCPGFAPEPRASVKTSFSSTFLGPARRRARHQKCDLEILEGHAGFDHANRELYKIKGGYPGTPGPHDDENVHFGLPRPTDRPADRRGLKWTFSSVWVPGVPGYPP